MSVQDWMETHPNYVEIVEKMSACWKSGQSSHTSSGDHGSLYQMSTQTTIEIFQSEPTWEANTVIPGDSLDNNKSELVCCVSCFWSSEVYSHSKSNFKWYDFLDMMCFLLVSEGMGCQLWGERKRDLMINWWDFFVSPINTDDITCEDYMFFRKLEKSCHGMFKCIGYVTGLAQTQQEARQTW